MVLIAPGLGALALSSSEKITEFMGFFVMVGNVSTVMAPGIVVLLLGVFGGLGTGAYRIAMSSFAVAMVLGIFLLLRIPDARTSEASTTSVVRIYAWSILDPGCCTNASFAHANLHSPSRDRHCGVGDALSNQRPLTCEVGALSSWMFASVQKYVQDCGFASGSIRGYSRSFAWIGVLLV
jgi:MFS family permease